MSLILDTNEVNTWIGHISEDARKFIVIICPYLKINAKLRRTIEVADSKGVRTFVIYGKRELDEGTMSWLRKLGNSSVACVPQLHAKLYMNEEFAVISSMNLYEYSQVNNEELGVLMGRREDKSEYKNVTFQAMRLIDLSEREFGDWDTKDISKPLRSIFKRGKEETFDPQAYVHDGESEEQKQEGPQPKVQESAEVPEAPSSRERIICHCIRCGHSIPSDHPYVYCGRCMNSWQRYSNLRYQEPDGHCYICGKGCEVSAERPACPNCYRQHRDLVNAKCKAMQSVSQR